MQDVGKTYFELFQLPQVFEVDQDALATAYRQLQRDMHPDRFAAHTDKEQRLAVQFAAFVNEAYTTLKSPLKRAIYLLTLQGISDDYDRSTVDDAAFLFEQMDLRETLSDLDAQAREGKADHNQLDALRERALEMQRAAQQNFASHYGSEDFASAKQQVVKLHFIAKFLKDLRALEDRLLD